MESDVVPACPPTPPATIAPDSVDQLYQELEDKVRTQRPREDLTPLGKAYRFAADRHKGQLRDSGEPYMMHPLEVTHLLADQQMDLICLQTGLLHDVVEDTTATIEEVRKLFGEEVAR